MLLIYILAISMSNNPTYHMMQSEKTNKVVSPTYEVPTTDFIKTEENPVYQTNLGASRGIENNYINLTTDRDIKMTKNPSYVLPWLWTLNALFCTLLTKVQQQLQSFIYMTTSLNFVIICITVYKKQINYWGSFNVAHHVHNVSRVFYMYINIFSSLISACLLHVN